MDKYLAHRGAIRALLGHGSSLFYATVHPEGATTALYELKVNEAKLEQTPLPTGGGLRLTADRESIFVATDENVILRRPLSGGELAPFGPDFPAPIAAMTPVAKGLAVLSGAELCILDLETGEARQRLDLGEEGSALAANPSGSWLAVGSVHGTLTIFEAENKERYERGDAQKLHQGAITALLFDPDELRVLSAGGDCKLYNTHVRGRLDPEDRGSKANHDQPITAMIRGLGGHFLTGSGDKSFKTWPGGVGKARPLTTKEGLRAVVGMAIVEHKKRPHLAVACDDASLRLWDLEEDGRPKERVLVFRGAMETAKYELGQKDTARRQRALQSLASYNDGPSIEILAERAISDDDHSLRVSATDLLGDTGNARAVIALEQLISSSDEGVRIAALAGLRKLRGASDLRPLELAIESGQADVGVRAVKGLSELASRDDQALTLLIKTLDRDPAEVRLAALEALAELHGEAGRPEAELTGLRSSKPDIRRLSLVHLFQHENLDLPKVQAALRRHGEDEDGEVRQTAFFISVLSRETLAAALRGRDKNIHRKLVELESFGSEEKPDLEPPEGPTPELEALGSADHRPLLQAMASRALDTCQRGATALALLQDSRAFGTLLQLSRERQSGTRVEVCKALRNLADPRGIARLRLMIRDGEASVRDAAFSALSLLEADRPLETAEAGLMAEHEDIRRRALQILIKNLREAPPSQPSDRSWSMLERALNDSFAEVRSEAFKATLNLQFAGGGEKTLRFALKSLHRDIRGEVFVEIMAQINESWAWPLLLDLFKDPDASLRKEVFDFATKKSKGRLVAMLSSALQCPYSDLRAEATKALANCKEPGAENLLFSTLDDKEESVRQLGLEALLGSGSPALSQVMKSKYPDVRVRAAHARALEGDPESLIPLLQIVTDKEPEIQDLRGPWLQRCQLALKGLAELGSPGALETLKPLLDHAEDSIRLGAAQALAYCSRPETIAILLEALRHQEEAVRLKAALGLAACGDNTGASVIFSGEGAKKGVDASVALKAAVALGRPAENNLLSFLDHNSGAVRSRAFLVLMLVELSSRDANPERCLAGLSAESPEIRLRSAEALENYSNQEAFETFVVRLFNERGGDKPWSVSPQTIKAIGGLLCGDDPGLRYRVMDVLDVLGQTKQDAFDKEWGRFSRRYKRELRALTNPDSRAARPHSAELIRLVFGTYVGLARLQGHDAAARIRQTALQRLVQCAEKEPSLTDSVRPALIQALSDSAQAVRRQAFDFLAAITDEVSVLCSEALASGQRDIGALGFKRLLESGDPKTSEALLDQVLKTSSDGLEHEAAKALAGIRGEVAVYRSALEALSEDLRREAVRQLTRGYDKKEEAREALRGALETRFRDVKIAAASELASKKDSAAFEFLVELLASDRKEEQRSAIQSLRRIDDPRSPGAFLDRLARDPAGTAEVGALFDGVGEARRPEVVDRLVAIVRKKPDQRDRAFEALVIISGYDQKVKSDIENPGWEEKQHPRRPEVLAKALEVSYRLSNEKQLSRLIPSARWCRTKEPEGVLSSLAFFPKDEVRHAAVEAIGWRLRKRDGGPDALEKALEHDDMVTRFLAAEGLALAGRKEGLNTLQVGVELLEDIRHKKRAVKALGKLGDEQALDLLLRLINEDGHALQEEAAEALGHMSDSDQADVVFRTLVRLADGGFGVAMSALTGLRWFASIDAWNLIRKRAEDHSWRIRQHVARLLAKDENPQSRKRLRAMIEKDSDSDVVEAATASLREICGPDSLEPDYALICGEHAYLCDENCLKRLKEKGDAAQILALLPRISEGHLQTIVEILLSRSPLPLAEASKALESGQERTLTVAAQIFGRAGSEASDRAPALEASALRFLARWSEERAKISDGDRDLASKMSALTETCRLLLWACGRLEGGAAALIEACSASFFKPIRRAALTGLSSGIGGEPGLAAMAHALEDADAEIRALAASGIKALDAERAAALIGKALDDRTSLDRLLEGIDGEGVRSSLRQAAATVHHQGVALPHLVSRGDVEGLAAALGDRGLSENTRLGALEGLARIGSEDAEAPLIALATNGGEDDDLRKAAWRAVRRSKRARQHKTSAAPRADFTPPDPKAEA